MGFGTSIFGNYPVRFDLDALTYKVLTPTQYTSASVSQLSNGWYKLSITGAASSTFKGDYTVGIIMIKNPEIASTTYTGDDTSGIYVWGRDMRLTTNVDKTPAYQRIDAGPDPYTIVQDQLTADDGSEILLAQ
jgi:hypothetical protein